MDKKIQEICLALIRISVYARRLEFRRRLEIIAFELLEEFFLRNIDPAIKLLNYIKEMVSFGRIIYEIEPVNADILIKEIESAILLADKFKDQDGRITPSGDIKGIFSRLPDSESKKRTKNKDNPAKNSESGNPANNPAIEPNIILPDSIDADNIDKNPAIKDNPAKSGNGFQDSTIRQNTIIEKIRTSGKPIQLRDILAMFPDLSERTIRYDIQRACNQGILEKIGSGPITSYKIRTI